MMGFRKYQILISKFTIIIIIIKWQKRKKSKLNLREMTGEEKEKTYRFENETIC